MRAVGGRKGWRKLRKANHCARHNNKTESSCCQLKLSPIPSHKLQIKSVVADNNASLTCWALWPRLITTIMSMTTQHLVFRSASMLPAWYSSQQVLHPQHFCVRGGDHKSGVSMSPCAHCPPAPCIISPRHWHEHQLLLQGTRGKQTAINCCEGVILQ